MSYQKKEQIKNRYKVFKFISLKKEFNKKDISESLNISFPTTTKYINDFLKLDIIKEIGLFDGSHGRKSLTYEFNPNSLYSIGVKLEVNRISIILINLLGQEIKKTEVFNNFYNDCNFVQYIIKELKKFLYNFDDIKKIKGIGISLPGIVDDYTKSFKIGTNFKLYSKDMKLIEEEMNLPIFLINEANAGAIGENTLSGYKYKNLAFISIDTGIGAGIILHDSIFHGCNSKAGEIGHMTVVPKGKKCSCGNDGCLERYCSNTSFIESFEESFNLKNLQLNDIFMRNLHTTEVGKKIIDNYIMYLGISIRNLQLLFDFKKIIVGGEITYYNDYFNFEERLKKEVFNNVFCENNKILELSKFGDSSNLFGAALIPIKNLEIINP